MRASRSNAVFVLAVLTVATTSIRSRAVTLEQCKLGVTSSGPVSEHSHSALSETEWASCRDLMAADLATAPRTEMYRVDPAGFPRYLITTKPGDYAVWGETESGAPQGAFDAFRPTTLVEASSDVTFRTAGLSTWSVVERPLLNTIALDSRLIAIGGASAGSPLGDLGGLLPSTALRTPLLPTRFVDPLTYNPHARDWEKTGVAVGSCAEWVWKKYWQYSRFEDATKACGNDASCLYDVAYASTTPPGIAYRDASLRGIDSTPIGASMQLLHGVTAKNPFFGVSPAFLRDQRAPLTRWLQRYDQQIVKGGITGGCVEDGPGPIADGCSPWVPFLKGSHKDDSPDRKLDLIAKLGAIDTLLKKKAAYAVGADAATVSAARAHGDTLVGTYATEWDWHKSLHDAQASLPRPITRAERQAIAERTEYLQSLLQEYTQLTTFKTCRAPAPMAPIDTLANHWKEIFKPSTPVDILRPKPIDVALKRLAVATMRGDLLPPQKLAQQILTGSAPAFASSQFATPFSLEATDLTPKSLPMPGQAPKSAPLSDIALVDINTTQLAGNLARRAIEPLCTIDQTFGGKPLSTKLVKVLERAQEVQEEIVDLLMDEYDRGEDGCLSESGIRCDWSAEFFSQRLVGQLSKEREQDYGTCLLYTNGDNFAPVRAAGLATLASLPTWFDRQQSVFTAAYKELPKLGTGNTTAIGESDHGDQGAGSADWFNAGYKYDLAYSIKPLAFTRVQGGAARQIACSFDLSATASFKAGVGILDGIVGPVCRAISAPLVSTGATELGSAATAANEVCDVYSRLKTLVDVRASVRSTGSLDKDATVTGAYNADVVLANERLYVGSDSASATGTGPNKTLFDIHQVVQPTEFTTSRLSSTVVVVVVPVTFQAYGELRMGANLDAKASQSIDCNAKTGTPNVNFDAFLGFRPFATAYAVGSAAIGVSGLQAGVRGRVALIDAQLPIDASLKLADGNLSPSVKASFSTDLLNGSMSAFAEVGAGPLRYTAEKELFSWRGWQKSLPIWSFAPTMTIPIGALNFESWKQFQTAAISGGS